MNRLVGQAEAWWAGRTLREQLDRRPEEVIRMAVRGMLPKNSLGRKQLLKMKV